MTAVSGPGPVPIDACRRWSVQRAEGPARRQVLSLMLSGRGDRRDPAVDEFLRYAREQRLAVDHVFAAFEGRRPIAAAMAVPNPGRTAMLALSPVSGSGLIEPHTAATLAAIADLPPAAAKPAQALVEPGRRLERAALAAAGFEVLTDLLYLQRPVGPGDDSDAPPRLPPGLTLTAWSPHARERFGRAIDTSYRGTLDCPRMLGMRSIEDVIDGHMGVGRFDPALWHVVEAGDQPAAVLLINRVPSHDACELVYLGLAEPWRGQGLGGVLVDWAARLTAARRVGRLLLAVDHLNTPAVRLYRRHGFRHVSRKTAMIRVAGAA